MILIMSSEKDPHAALISAGLRKLSQPVQIWNPSASPLQQAVTVSLHHDLDTICETGTSHWEGNQPQVVWYRRAGQVTAPIELPKASHEVFRREALDARHCMFSALETFDATWVNSWTNARRADNKLLQLMYAKRARLNVPQTLISNSPERIRAFYENCNGKIIHKMFNSAVFDDGCTACTTVVPAGAMTQSASLAICPAIYQNLVDKVFDVRVFVMGSTLLCIKLEGSDTEIDIRTSRARKASRVELPAHISLACLRLTRSLGLLTGSIDLAYTTDGQWVFFEINESGQFLWLETLVPEVPALDAFCRFLCAPTEDFVYEANATRIDANELLRTEFANGSQMPSNNSTC